MKDPFFKPPGIACMEGHLQRFLMKFSWGILGVLVLVVFSSACSEKSGKPAPAPIPVVVGKVVQKALGRKRDAHLDLLWWEDCSFLSSSHSPSRLSSTFTSRQRVKG